MFDRFNQKPSASVRCAAHLGADRKRFIPVSKARGVLCFVANRTGMSDTSTNRRISERRVNIIAKAKG